MTQQTVAKTCLACGKPVKGRSDKKFCDDYCRNGYNNDLKSDSNNYVRNINNTLRKNRRILEDCLAVGDEMMKTTRDKLLHRGFQFKYITHTYTNKKGNIYYFCYEYGYLPLNNNWYLVVRHKN
ncbi:MAG: hypothetical protein ABI813_01065 [Bacteroidota bacterium]